MGPLTDVMVIISVTMIIIGLVGLAAICIITAFGISLPLGFLVIFGIGLSVGVIATNFE